MIKNQPQSTQDADPLPDDETALAAAQFKAAQRALPFVSDAADGSMRFWPEQSSLPEGHCAAQRVEGERWALELLRFYRDFGHEPRARILRQMLSHGGAGTPAGSEHFSGLVRVLDAMLAFAARQSDLDGYAASLHAEHKRTLSAWAALEATAD